MLHFYLFMSFFSSRSMPEQQKSDCSHR